MPIRHPFGVAAALLLAAAAGSLDRASTRAADPSVAVNVPASSLQTRGGESDDLPQVAGGRAVEEKTIPEAMAVVERGLIAVQALRDYSCVLVKREVINGRQQEQQYIFLKCRREPFSAYLYFLRPESRMGQEAIYVEGQRDGRLVAHGVGWEKRLGGVKELEPTSALAMRGSRHPITEIGMENLLRIVSNLPQSEPGFGSCRVRFFPDRQVAGRKCLGLEFAHTKRVEGATFLAMRLYFDAETAFPLRQELWQRDDEGKPVLTEEYTYADVKSNRGYKDLDFDPKNPAYDYD